MTSRYETNCACNHLEDIARSGILSDDYIKNIYIIIEAARKYVKIKEALV